MKFWVSKIIWSMTSHKFKRLGLQNRFPWNGIEQVTPLFMKILHEPVCKHLEDFAYKQKVKWIGRVLSALKTEQHWKANKHLQLEDPPLLWTRMHCLKMPHPWKGKLIIIFIWDRQKNHKINKEVTRDREGEEVLQIYKQALSSLFSELKHL